MSKYLVCLTAPIGWKGYYLSTYRYKKNENFETYRDSLSPDLITSIEVEAPTKYIAEGIALEHIIKTRKG